MERLFTNKWKYHGKLKVVRCKFCDSINVVKYGHFKNSQQWWCKDCQRKFSDSSTTPGMKAPTNQGLLAINMYYNKGMSFRRIKDEINKRHNVYINEVTVYRWIDKASRRGSIESEQYKPLVGDIWVAKETIIKVATKYYYIVDIIDIYTRFLLASKLFVIPNENNIKSSIYIAIYKAQKIPKNLIILPSLSHFNITKLNFDNDYKDIEVSVANKEKRSVLIKEYFPFKSRNENISRLKKRESIQKVVDGWKFHYNFRRVNNSLLGKTPAEETTTLMAKMG